MHFQYSSIRNFTKLHAGWCLPDMHFFSLAIQAAFFSMSYFGAFYLFDKYTFSLFRHRLMKTLFSNLFACPGYLASFAKLYGTSEIAVQHMCAISSKNILIASHMHFIYDQHVVKIYFPCNDACWCELKGTESRMNRKMLSQIGGQRRIWLSMELSVF